METFKLNGVVASHAQDNNYDVLSMSDDEMDMGADMGMGAGAGAGTEAGIDLDLEKQQKPLTSALMIFLAQRLMIY